MNRHHQVHVWFNDDLYAELAQLARQNDEPISAALRRIVLEHFRDRPIPDKRRQRTTLAPDRDG
jgi:hypothetical protein